MKEPLFTLKELFLIAYTIVKDYHNAWDIAQITALDLWKTDKVEMTRSFKFCMVMWRAQNYMGKERKTQEIFVEGQMSCSPSLEKLTFTGKDLKAQARARRKLRRFIACPRQELREELGRSDYWITMKKREARLLLA